MKTLTLSALAAALLLSACTAQKTPESAPQLSAEEAIKLCTQSGGNNQDRAVLDACMKDKGFQRTNAQAATPPASTAPAP